MMTEQEMREIVRKHDLARGFAEREAEALRKANSALVEAVRFLTLALQAAQERAP